MQLRRKTAELFLSDGLAVEAALGAARRAHATYHASHMTDVATGVAFAMDLTPLIWDETRDVTAFVQERINRFAPDMQDRLRRMEG